MRIRYFIELFGVFAACWLSNVLPVEAELFSSMAALESIVKTERDLIAILRKHRDREVEKINAAYALVQNLGTDLQTGDAVIISKRFHSNPVRAFAFAQRHSTDWTVLMPLIRENTTDEFSRDLKSLRKLKDFPSQEDLIGVAEGLRRLQFTYKITSEDIAYGQVPDTRATPLFEAAEAFSLGQLLANGSHYGYAHQWFKTAEMLYEAEEEKSVHLVNILDWLQLSGYLYDGNATKALRINSEIREIDPQWSNLDQDFKFYTDHLANLTEEERAAFDSPEEPFKDPQEDALYESLCRGEYSVAKRVIPYLKCYYTTHNNPYLLLQPIKYEVAHVDPDVFMLHDVLLPSEMDEIQKVSLDKLKRAKVFDKHSDGTVSESRVSQSAFMQDKSSPAFASSSRHAGLATNLDARRAEPLQVNNYGIAGMYLPHWDYFKGFLDETKEGDRIATFMYYLSDVEAGGATVFPVLNVTLFPKKGSAAFWYNLYKDGEVDSRTFHSGCPVLAGSKWVANKWFRIVGQDVARPCGLTKDSPDVVPEPPANGTVSKVEHYLTEAEILVAHAKRITLALTTS